MVSIKLTQLVHLQVRLNKYSLKTYLRIMDNSKKDKSKTRIIRSGMRFKYVHYFKTDLFYLFS